jgi:hypothetical protein
MRAGSARGPEQNAEAGVIVKRIQGALLDFWVAKSAGLKVASAPAQTAGPVEAAGGSCHLATYRPSSDWSLGGPIVSNEWYVIEGVLIDWFGADWAGITAIRSDPLKWFMRAYVVSNFGEEVEDIDLATLFGPEIRFADAAEPPASPAPTVPAMRRAGPMRVLGAMIGRR